MSQCVSYFNLTSRGVSVAACCHMVILNSAGSAGKRMNLSSFDQQAGVCEEVCIGFAIWPFVRGSFSEELDRLSGSGLLVE
jgi:hypothetical protein